MSGRKCDAITAAKTRCGNWALKGQTLCIVHHPDYAEQRRIASSTGGKNKATEKRVMRRVPSDIKSTLDTLFRTLSGLEDGTVPANQAQAISSVARAICTAWETGMIEAKLKEIEDRIAAKTPEQVA